MAPHPRALLLLPLAVLLLASLPPPRADAWGKEGHIMVCKIAEVALSQLRTPTALHRIVVSILTPLVWIAEVPVGEGGGGGAGPAAGVGGRGAVDDVPVGRRGALALPLGQPAALRQHPRSLRLQVLAYALSSPPSCFVLPAVKRVYSLNSWDLSYAQLSSVVTQFIHVLKAAFLIVLSCFSCY